MWVGGWVGRGWPGPQTRVTKGPFQPVQSGACGSRRVWAFRKVPTGDVTVQETLRTEDCECAGLGRGVQDRRAA